VALETAWDTSCQKTTNQKHKSETCSFSVHHDIKINFAFLKTIAPFFLYRCQQSPMINRYVFMQTSTYTIN